MRSFLAGTGVSRRLFVCAFRRQSTSPARLAEDDALRRLATRRMRRRPLPLRAWRIRAAWHCSGVQNAALSLAQYWQVHPRRWLQARAWRKRTAPCQASDGAQKQTRICSVVLYEPRLKMFSLYVAAASSPYRLPLRSLNTRTLMPILSLKEALLARARDCLWRSSRTANTRANPSKRSLLKTGDTAPGRFVRSARAASYPETSRAS